jgi:RimK family alpha-L-glutamate ligase
MRLLFLVALRVPPVPSPVLVEASALLRRRGFTVDTAILEDEQFRCDSIDLDHDLYVLKSHTELSLSVAAALDSRGAFLLNPYRSCTSAQDKAVSMARLAAAGVAVPRTWVTADLSRLEEIAASGPVIIKPHRGHRGAGISVVRDERDLATLSHSTFPAVIQDFVDGSGEDLKVYVVGDRVFAVRKPFSENSFTRPGRECRVTREIEKLALRTGEAFGLGLYGIDVIESPDGPVVVDVNYFPGYKGIAGVAPVIAEYIEGYATGRYELGLPGVVPDVPAPIGAGARRQR